MLNMEMEKVQNVLQSLETSGATMRAVADELSGVASSFGKAQVLLRAVLRRHDREQWMLYVTACCFGMAIAYVWAQRVFGWFVV